MYKLSSTFQFRKKIGKIKTIVRKCWNHKLHQVTHSDALKGLFPRLKNKRVYLAKIQHNLLWYEVAFVVFVISCNGKRTQ